jgi:hypothetical protein
MFLYRVYLSKAVLNDEVYWKIFEWLFFVNIEVVITCFFVHLSMILQLYRLYYGGKDWTTVDSRFDSREGQKDLSLRYIPLKA